MNKSMLQERVHNIHRLSKSKLIFRHKRDAQQSITNEWKFINPFPALLRNYAKYSHIIKNEWFRFVVRLEPKTTS